MYTPKYIIITDILKNIGQIEAAREVIENAPLVPMWEAKFRDDARLRAVHYGTALEGNDLSLGEAKIILEREVETPAEAAAEGVAARERDVQEVINYRKVLEYLEKSGVNAYTREELWEIHRLVVDKIVPAEQVGKYRQVQVVLRNSVTGEVGFRPPLAMEVPYLMDDFFRYINSELGGREHPILRAGVAHYVVAAVHPFTEGNGRTARAFATLMLHREGYDIRRFFSLEEYYDKDAVSYYENLQKASAGELTTWLEYFTNGAAIEFEKIKEKILKLSKDVKMKERFGGQQIYLTERQMKLIEYLTDTGFIQNQMFVTVFPDVSEDTVLRDLQDLIKKGLIKKVGSTKAARYAMI